MAQWGDDPAEDHEIYRALLEPPPLRSVSRITLWMGLAALAAAAVMIGSTVLIIITALAGAS